jgi:hypothetical protein
LTSPNVSVFHDVLTTMDAQQLEEVDRWGCRGSLVKGREVT